MLYTGGTYEGSSADLAGKGNDDIAAVGLGGGGRAGELVKRTKSIDQSKDSNNNTIVKTRICSRF